MRYGVLKQRDSLAHGYPLAKDRILIAEDDPLTREDLQYRLESLGYEVAATASRAREAVTLAERLKPDLILMDIQLPGEMDGIQAAEQLHTLRLPVIYVTGYHEGPILQRAKTTQPYGYVIKPYETHDLKVSVEVGICKHRADREREHLMQQFEAALASARILNGILPICAYCKKKSKTRPGSGTKLKFISCSAPALLSLMACVPAALKRSKNSSKQRKLAPCRAGLLFGVNPRQLPGPDASSGVTCFLLI